MVWSPGAPVHVASRWCPAALPREGSSRTRQHVYVQGLGRRHTPGAGRGLAGGGGGHGRGAAGSRSEECNPDLHCHGHQGLTMAVSTGYGMRPTVPNGGLAPPPPPPLHQQTDPRCHPCTPPPPPAQSRGGTSKALKVLKKIYPSVTMELQWKGPVWVLLHSLGGGGGLVSGELEGPPGGGGWKRTRYLSVVSDNV